MESDSETTLVKMEKKKVEVKELELEIEDMEKELKRKRDLVMFKKVMIGFYEVRLDEERLESESRKEVELRFEQSLNEWKEDELSFERQRENERWREWDRSIENDPTYRSVFED